MIKNYTMKTSDIFQSFKTSSKLDLEIRNQHLVISELSDFMNGFHGHLWWEVFLREAEKKNRKTKAVQKYQLLKGGTSPVKINGWNIIMEVWKIIFLRKWVICRFHVYLPGCKIWSKTIDCWCLAAWNMSGCMVCRVDSHGLFLWPFHFGVR